MEDLADAYSDAFGGAKGMALAMYEMAMDPEVRAATRLKIFTKVDKTLADASRIYGDRAKLSSMSTEQIEARLVALLKKHGFISPIPGVNLVASAEKETAAESEEAPAEDRESQE